MSYVIEALVSWPGPGTGSGRPLAEWWQVMETAFLTPERVVASCPTREAAEAARRLLSGECARELADAQIDRLVAAKTGAGKPMCRSCERGRPHYDAGKADGAAQERARIVAFLRVARFPWSSAVHLAERIERGEAGE